MQIIGEGPNVRTGSESRSGPTAATCIFAPMSMAAARDGWGTCPVLDRTSLLSSHASILLWQTAEGLGCAEYQFPNRDRRRRHHSQVRNNPWTTFFYGNHPPKICRPLPSHADPTADRFSGHRRKTKPRSFFKSRLRRGILLRMNRAAAAAGSGRSLRSHLPTAFFTGTFTEKAARHLGLQVHTPPADNAIGPAGSGPRTTNSLAVSANCGFGQKLALAPGLLPPFSGRRYRLAL